MKKLTIYSDGAARGNPGPAASAWLILDGTDVLESNVQSLVCATNNTAEYTALISALKALPRFCTPQETELEIYSDSELMINHLNRKYVCRAANLVPLYNTVREFESQFASVSYTHVPRENGYISSCDWLCNQCLDTASASGCSTRIPEFTCKPIGIVQSPFHEIKDTPKQGYLTGEMSRIEIYEEYQAGLDGLSDGDDIFVLCWFDRSNRSILQVKPHGPDKGKMRGVFSTRAPVRPNPISLTLVKLVRINGCTLTVKGLEALDKTPVLDIKPFYDDIDSPSSAS